MIYLAFQHGSSISALYQVPNLIHAVNFSMLQPPHSSATLPQLQLLVQRCLLTAAPGSSLFGAISSWDKSSNCQSVNTHFGWEICRNCLTLLDKIWPTSNSPDNPQVPLATRHVAHAKLVEPQHVVVAEVPRMQHCGCIVLSKHNCISTCSTKSTKN